MAISLTTPLPHRGVKPKVVYNDEVLNEDFNPTVREIDENNFLGY